MFKDSCYQRVLIIYILIFMKFICKICGYIYDEESEGTPFSSLPDSWKCPICGAKKNNFTPLKEENSVEEPKEAKPSTNTSIESESDHDDLTHLSVAQMSVICSNLAKNCQKQFMLSEAEKFTTIANYLDSITPAASESEVADIIALLTSDIDEKFPALDSIASSEGDRGALRVKTWGLKVSLILKNLLERYILEGENFLKNTDIWVCTVCGFVFVGENPPNLCPVCKVPDWKFEKIDGRR